MTIRDVWERIEPTLCSDFKFNIPLNLNTHTYKKVDFGFRLRFLFEFIVVVASLEPNLYCQL